ncbi:MAG: tRNA (adenosine(37)-N6)-threonylcarbamoyltransferase complex transferase subunit TsaD [Clostridiales bacterium]|jgi:N6-L-threonylcarbamoyladenine synthase|nr:tRNA (adenosine(37)-N6)-threonylcarbamoyltransferase complex transferase subunit TsaD [Clostridiales bacterium]
MEKIRILGIETSCDETSAAVVENGRAALSDVIYSQIEEHKKYGGVVPEIASRRHIVKIDDVVAAALDEAGLELRDISAVAVTHGPGLVGALLVGLNFAKAMAYGADLPLIGVHHIAGHIASNYLESDWRPPFVSLIVSGGHTQLIHVKDYDNFKILGKTLDDAAGEAYDKVARCLGLPYPGGLEIDRLAQAGNANAIDFPRVWLGAGSFDFSFSGLKSAVLNHLNSAKMGGRKVNPADIAASFQQAVVDVLVKKSIAACQTAGCGKLAVAGGVAANSHLRRSLEKACAAHGIVLHIPKPAYCTDNAAMIAAAGYYDYIKGRFDGPGLNAVPSLVLGESNEIAKATL